MLKVTKLIRSILKHAGLVSLGIFICATVEYGLHMETILGISLSILLVLLPWAFDDTAALEDNKEEDYE